MYDIKYSWLSETQTLYNSNLLLIQSNFHFPLDHFQYNFTLDNWNFFLFPLKVHIVWSQLYAENIHAPTTKVLIPIPHPSRLEILFIFYMYSTSESLTLDPNPHS